MPLITFEYHQRTRGYIQIIDNINIIIYESIVAEEEIKQI